MSKAYELINQKLNSENQPFKDYRIIIPATDTGQITVFIEQLSTGAFMSTDIAHADINKVYKNDTVDEVQVGAVMSTVRRAINLLKKP